MPNTFPLPPLQLPDALTSGLVTVTFDLLSLNVVSQSHVTLATSMPILVFLGLSVLDLGLMYATDVRLHTVSLLYLPIRGGT